MRRAMWALLVAGMLLSLSACAYLKDEQANGAHFASWQHMGYSLWRGTPQATTKSDIASAEQQRWWGDVVRVQPIQ